MPSKTKTQLQHRFSEIPQANISRSRFDRSHGIKTTLDVGFLIPIFTDEAYPGDTFSLTASLFGRLATPLHPFMDNLYLDTHFFFIPLRLVWNNFQKFMGEQEDPGDSVDFLIPTMAPSAGFAEGSLGDYFGMPTKQNNLEVSALYHRAYALVYNEWFRDQNLIDSVIVHKDDGPDPEGDYAIQRRGKRHDYFTSCLPFPQKGPSVGAPLSGTAVVTPIGGGPAFGKPTFNAGGTTDVLRADVTQAFPVFGTADQTFGTAVSWIDPQLEADLSGATASTINALRLAFQIQRLYERDARGGTRYIENIKSHFGVTSPDARLQRPEYLGGGSTPLNIQPVPQTSSSDVTSPQGNLAGFGTVASNTGHSFSKSFTEHGIVIGLVSIRGDLNYQQGLNKKFSRRTKHDFYWPSLAQIGEQAVLRKEILATGNPVFDDVVFGYQERFAELRHMPSLITGQMRSNAATSLDTWHLAQDLVDPVVLDKDFIEENPPVDRVIAVDSEPHIILDGHFTYHCARPMPMYGVPGNMDRF